MSKHNNNDNNTLVRYPLLIAAILIVVGCSSVGDDTSVDASEADSQEIGMLDTANTRGLAATFDFLFGDPAAPPSREAILQGSYPVAYVQAGNNPRTIMSLGQSAPYGEIWFSGAQAVILAHGRVIGSGDVTPADIIAVTNLAADPLRCMLQAERSACATSWQRTMDIRPSKMVESIYERGDVIVSYDFSSTFALQGNKVTEMGTATNAVGETFAFENSFTITDGRVSESRQWLGPHVGYLDYEVVKVPTVADRTRYQAPTFAFDAPSGNRLSLLLENGLVANRLSAEHYWPLLRIHNDNLQQKFEARKQGMLVRLRLLREYYNGEGQSELAAATQELLEAFQSWPLRATYQHGVQPPQMLIDFSDNPYLSPADAGTFGEYTVSIPRRPDGHRVVGLSDSSADAFPVPGIYDVQPNGSIQARPAADAMLLPLPGNATVRLQSIPDAQLPPGFRDMNYQLALFLQHWDWAADAVADGGAE